MKKIFKIILLSLLVIVIFIVIAFILQVSLYLKEIKTNQPPQKLTSSQQTMVTNDDPSSGSPNAKIHIVEFSDFQCPFCRQSFPVVRKLMLEYGDQIYFVFRDFPISDLHPQAQKAAEAGECAHEQGKFWPMHDKIFQNQENITVSDLKNYAIQIGLDTTKFNQCLDTSKYASEVRSDLVDGALAGVTSTPTFFINGSMVEGTITESAFRRIFAEILSN